MELLPPLSSTWLATGKLKGSISLVYVDDEWIQVVQATRGIVARGVLDAAIRLLPHLEEPVRGVTSVGIVGQTCSRKRERPVRQIIEIVYSRIEIGELGSLCGPRRPGGQQVEIAVLQRRLDGGQEWSRRARRKRRRFSCGGAGRKIQGRLRQGLVRSLFICS